MLSPVEAFLGFFSRITIITIKQRLSVRGADNREHNGVALLLLTFTVDAPHQPDDPLNSSKDNRYLTVFFASWPDGDLNILAERN